MKNYWTDSKQHFLNLNIEMNGVILNTIKIPVHRDGNNWILMHDGKDHSVSEWRMAQGLLANIASSYLNDLMTEKIYTRMCEGKYDSELKELPPKLNQLKNDVFDKVMALPNNIMAKLEEEWARKFPKTSN